VSPREQMRTNQRATCKSGFSTPIVARSRPVPNTD
jgi:hypothetical protein